MSLPLRSERETGTRVDRGRDAQLRPRACGRRRMVRVATAEVAATLVLAMIVGADALHGST